jgi:hypothetical protein
MRIARYGNTRYWAVYDGATLVCVCVYKRGAMEVVRRLSNREHLPLIPATRERGAFFCALLPTWHAHQRTASDVRRLQGRGGRRRAPLGARACLKRGG